MSWLTDPLSWSAATTPQMSRRDLAEACNDCNRDVDPDDAAPSCGAHVLCVPCFTTSDFRCRECRRVWDELARAETW